MKYLIPFIALILVISVVSSEEYTEDYEYKEDYSDEYEEYDPKHEDEYYEDYEYKEDEYYEDYPEDHKDEYDEYYEDHSDEYEEYKDEYDKEYKDEYYEYYPEDYNEEELLASEIDFIVESSFEGAEALRDQLTILEENGIDTSELLDAIEEYEKDVNAIKDVKTFDELWVLNDKLVQDFAFLSSDINEYFMGDDISSFDYGESEDLEGEKERMVAFFLEYVDLLRDQLKDLEDKEIDIQAIEEKIDDFEKQADELYATESFEELYSTYDDLNEEYFILSDEVNHYIFEEYNQVVEEEYMKESLEFLLEDNEFIIKQLYERLEFISLDIDTSDIEKQIEEFVSSSETIAESELSWELIEELAQLNEEAFILEQELIRLEEQTIDEEIIKEYIEDHKPEFEQFLMYMEQDIKDLEEKGVDTSQLNEDLQKIKDLVAEGEALLEEGKIREANDILYGEDLYTLADDLIEGVEEKMGDVGVEDQEHLEDFLAEGDEFLTELEDFLEEKEGKDADQAKEQVLFLRKTLNQMTQEFNQGNYEKIFELMESDAVQQSIELLDESLYNLEEEQ